MDEILNQIALNTAITSSVPLTTSARRSYVLRERALMMSKLSRFILFFYFISLLRPAVPMVADFVAHTFYEQEHIMMVHEVQGQFHIHDEIGKNLSHSDQEKGTMSYDTVEYCHVSSVSFATVEPEMIRQVCIPGASSLSETSIDVLSPPPCA